MLVLTSLVPDSFSLDTLNKVTKPVRSSTCSTYNHFYHSFSSFIFRRNGKSHFQLSEVIEFFNDLVNKGFRSTTLKSIRSVLREPLKLYFPDFDLLKDPWVSNLIKYVRANSLKCSFSFPKWDLDIVLRMLKCRESQELDFVFKKTLFIVFIACPYRISEFRAISLSASSFSSLHALLKPHLLFQSKNQTDSFIPQPIVIQNFPDDPSICPVTLLNAYINLTGSLCQDKNVNRPDQLWLNSNLKPLSLNLMRKWVKDIIFMADPNAVSSVKVHSIRSQVASHLLASGVSVKEIVAAMNWRSSSTFTKFYARLGIQTSVKAVLAGHLAR